jgi:polyhydroxybutyrate depolymerase|nr:PHB depolymerase family esterase [Kofleriaceae bacterium]
MKAAWLAGVLLACSSPHGGGGSVDGGGGGGGGGGELGDGGSATGGGSALACSGKSAQPLDATWMVGSAGRSALVHVPASYDPATPTPVVLDFHGLAGSASQEAALTGADAEADTAGFISVHPASATSIGSWNAGDCCGEAQAENLDDMSYVGALLDELDAQLCVDDARVYAMGLSNGGYMSHRLGCELSDRIAAIGPVAGAIGVTCQPPRPVPVFEVHGNADPLVPYALGSASAAQWAQMNGCTSSSTTFQNGVATCVTQSGCTAGADVTFCTIAGGGHQWPGGETLPFLGSNTDDLHATDAIWTFFAAHPKP